MGLELGEFGFHCSKSHSVIVRFYESHKTSVGRHLDILFLAVLPVNFTGTRKAINNLSKTLFYLKVTGIVIIYEAELFWKSLKYGLCLSSSYSPTTP